MNVPPTCPNFDRVLFGVDRTSNQAMITRARCKQWSCDHCAERNRRHWQAHLLHTISAGDFLPSWYFLTITADGWNRTTHGSATALMQAWPSVVQLLRDKAKYMGQGMEYVRVFEAHKDGALHIHAIVNMPIFGRRWPDKRFKKAKGITLKEGDDGVSWVRLQDYLGGKTGVGWRCDVKRIQAYSDYSPVAVTVKYVTKYMTKEAQSFELPDNARRIVTSRALALKPKPNESEAQWALYRDYSVEDFYHALSEYGEVVDLDQLRPLNTDDFDPETLRLT